MWSTIVTSLLGMVGDTVTGWRQTRQARVEARIEIERMRAQHEISWDVQQARNAETSWKDEFWTIVLATPMILCFIPGMVPYIERGFVVMRDVVPDWYIAAVSVAIAAAFGWNRAVRLINRSSGRPQLASVDEETNGQRRD